ncbi:PREDICTED: putative wall-associated receptor kinase-like 16 [Tarenaya hassleriana]|uniref:putative wall-associated receptor kinase-like 16 n=1 Tax=Tarenaya hassleriana TaxID=28532 RepID=UPI00053CA6A0|nr:PREDICTED: putative wall-associated receptor kinase-like 16 [Tarenaya hassleriana]
MQSPFAFAFAFVLALAFAFEGRVRSQPKDGCRGNCGNLTIHYPFGTEQGCYLNDGFLITCDRDSDKPFFRKTDVQVLGVSRDGEITLQMPRSYECFNYTGDSLEHKTSGWLSGFPLSSNRNKLIGIGCNTYAYLEGPQGTVYPVGCQSTCLSFNNSERSRERESQTSQPPMEDGLCSGIGCCQVSIPEGIKYFRPVPYSLNNHSLASYFNPCIYTFLVEDGHFNFSVSDLQNLRNITEFPVVFNWFIGDLTCRQVGNNSVCSENSDCIDFGYGPGYTCRCRDGYDGNPYLPNGCRDINECERGNHDCAKPEYCRNNNGSFHCICPKGYKGDATKRCIHNRQEWPVILLGTTVGFLTILLSLCCINQELKRRKQDKLREKFFEQNGGIMLRQRLLRTHSSEDDVRIFTEEEIRRATNNFHESRILGEGGQGTVYKGILPDSREIAIKKARIGDHSQVEQFINEVIVLSMINHRNVVKLLGCCLETEVPLLIYEFMRNGTLFDHLHSPARFNSFLQWEDRLRIAIETAETISYLHSSASVPIVHRDVKPANILLDEKFSAKVSDFGASRLIPSDREQLTTLVQGTLGYLDPEYFHTSTLNEKSDVYSFGVVLMELVSGQKALCFRRSESDRHLVACFASALKENRLDQILENRLQVSEENGRQLKEVAELAVWCTRVKGEERPRMKEVASELEGIRVSLKHHRRRNGHFLLDQENEHLLGDQNLYDGTCNDNNSDRISGYYTI